MRSYQSPSLHSVVIDELSVEIEDEIDENNNYLSLNSVKSGIPSGHSGSDGPADIHSDNNNGRLE